MKVAKFVFMAAGIWGILITLPLYFLRDWIGVQLPPAITHPEFYYGFAGVVLAWQFAFLLIGSNPVRYRLLIIPAVVEKFSFVLASAALFSSGQITASQAGVAIPDLVLGLFFIASFLTTRRQTESAAGHQI
ncbi:MAG TPA: hypothetical protein V6C97_32245 [Oculatellaceae cyanobacterium]